MNRMTTGSASETKHTNQGVSVLREHHMSIRLTSVTTSGAKTAVPRGICNAKTPSGCRFKPTTFGKFVKLCNANIIDATAIGIEILPGDHQHLADRSKYFFGLHDNRLRFFAEDVPLQHNIIPKTHTPPPVVFLLSYHIFLPLARCSYAKSCSFISC